MDWVVAAFSGTAAGCVELWLLTVLIKALLKGNTTRTALLIPAKLLVMAAGLVPALLLTPNWLWLAGCCLAAPLVIGAPVAAVLKNRKKGGGKP